MCISSGGQKGRSCGWEGGRVGEWRVGVEGRSSGVAQGWGPSFFLLLSGLLLCPWCQTRLCSAMLTGGVGTPCCLDLLGQDCWIHGVHTSEWSCPSVSIGRGENCEVCRCL